MKCVSRVQPGVGQYESVLYERKVSLWLGLVKVINFYMAVRSFSVLSFLPHITHYSGCTLCVSQPPIQRVCVCRSVWRNGFNTDTHSQTPYTHTARCKRTKTHRTLGDSFPNKLPNHCMEIGILRPERCVCVCAFRCDTRMPFACRENWWRKWKMSRRK